MPSLAWRDVLKEVGLRPWLALDSQGVVPLDADDQDGGQLSRRLHQLEIALLDGRLPRASYEMLRRGAIDYLRGDCWLGFSVKERVSGLHLIDSLTALVRNWGHSAQLSVESFGTAGSAAYEYLVVRFRFSSHDEFCLWCQILMSALLEIPV